MTNETQYNEGAKTFEPEDIPAKIDASEFRDLTGYADVDITRMARPGPDSSAVSAEGERAITRDKARALRVTDDATGYSEYDDVQNVGARTYATSTIWLNPTNDYAAPVPVLLMAADSARMRALVMHAGPLDSSGFIIGSMEQIQSGQGYFVPPRTQTEIKVQGAVYATFPNFVAETAASTPITLWIERGI